MTCLCAFLFSFGNTVQTTAILGNPPRGFSGSPIGHWTQIGIFKNSLLQKYYTTIADCVYTTPAIPPAPLQPYLYVHQQAKSTFQSCRRIGTLANE